MLGLKKTMKRQDGPKKDIKSLEVPKNSIWKKCYFLSQKAEFSSLGGSQDEHKRLKSALKRHLKSFKTRQIRVPKIDLNLLILGTGFRVDPGPKMDPKITKK